MSHFFKYNLSDMITFFSHPNFYVKFILLNIIPCELILFQTCVARACLLEKLNVEPEQRLEVKTYRF